MTTTSEKKFRYELQSTPAGARKRRSPGAEAPDWFVAALADEPETGTTVVDGTSVAWRAWGPARGAGVVLVHGGAAHARWWDHIAPALVEGGRRVVAVDLSGHGDSGRREEYDLDAWAAEVAGVVAAMGFRAPPVVIGHSMGGFVTLKLAARLGRGLAAAIVVDSPVRELTREERELRAARVVPRQPKVHESFESAVRRFRPIPDQEVLDYVAAHIARHSLRPVPDGWVWKFDTGIYGREFLEPGQVDPVECRVVLVRGQHGMLTGRMSAALRERLGGTATEIEIPDAGHHIMLDEPLSLIATLRGMLDDEPLRAGSAEQEDAAAMPSA
ncbi:alpha/beta hydrolase [Microbacterium sp. BWT-B31]|uniref:alpha/beta fold hydrolase n=1 Tax=Microbacterium sp. BWT-B31 TaxID=3232072 RepID=UPI00352997C1